MENAQNFAAIISSMVLGPSFFDIFPSFPIFPFFHVPIFMGPGSRALPGPKWAQKSKNWGGVGLGGVGPISLLRPY